MGGHDETAHATCGIPEALVFIAALVAGTFCSLTSKVMLDMNSVGISGEPEVFSYPLFQTFGMFLGMTAALWMHWIVLRFKIPFPGYYHKMEGYTPIPGEDAVAEPEPIPVWVYFLLIIPSMFDLAATALCMYGLRYVDVSIYQMLRGSAIVFVAILKHFVLNGKLKKYMWVGIFWNVVSIVLVGITAVFAQAAVAAPDGSGIGDVSDMGSDMSSDMSDSSGGVMRMLQEAAGGSDGGGKNPTLGVTLILAGAFVQSLQYAFEEKVMTMNFPTPPLLLIGMEGLWGTIICLFALYPAAYYLPGSDHGSVENPWNTLVMIQNSPTIQKVFVLYFFSIFFYNMLACLVTFMLNSVWHAILDNFRPITVWGSDLFIYYFISKAFGEKWTVYSFIQLAGLFVLLYGTAVYNAPNPGSILLRGEWFNCCLDYSKEYDSVLINLDGGGSQDGEAEWAEEDGARSIELLRQKHGFQGGTPIVGGVPPSTSNAGTPSRGGAHNMPSPYYRSFSPFMMGSPAAHGFEAGTPTSMAQHRERVRQQESHLLETIEEKTNKKKSLK